MAGFAQSPNARIPEVPDAGRSLREIESTQPEFAPLPDQAPLDDSAARPAPAPSGDPDGGARLHVRAFRLQGNLHVDTDALQTQLADLNGSEQDLTGLRAAADHITRYYHDQGLSARARLSSAAGNPRRRGRHRRTGRRVRRDPARQPVARERRGVAPGTVRAAARRSRAHRQSGKPPAAPERPARRRSARHATRGRAPRLQHAAGQRRAHAAGHRQHRRRQLRRLLHRRIPPGRQPGREQPAAPGRPTQPAPANQRPQAALLLRRLPGAGRPPSPAWA